uniref:NADH-ubiquinone oxidoreductase chain 2 n=1 Tax=Culicoides actoni TaxID=469747 RepID=A8B0L4_9DIPT|nr:NADH dehydrogenase subunit 2 [Culicoides actoni]
MLIFKNYPKLKIMYKFIIHFISKMIFLLMLMLGTLITLSSSSWIGMWIGLELNLLSFIPLMIKNNTISTESAIKYFLIQTLASLLFLFSSIIYIMKFSFFNHIFMSYENYIITFSMMLKLGAAPFHFWFPNIIEGLSWMNSLILLTWQKLAPLVIISYFNFFKYLIIFIMLSALIGSIMGLNQTSLQKLMAFSSINHISWLLMAELFNNYIWFCYFMFYAFINLSIIMIFKNFNFFSFNQIYLNNYKKTNKNLLMKSCLFYNFLSLGGLPPFLGFMPKWLVIENMIYLKMFFLIFFLIMMALITLFFYIRLTFSAFMLSYTSMKWNMLIMNKKYNFMLLLFLNFINITCLMIIMMNLLI